MCSTDLNAEAHMKEFDESSWSEAICNPNKTEAPDLKRGWDDWVCARYLGVCGVDSRDVDGQIRP